MKKYITVSFLLISLFCTVFAEEKTEEKKEEESVVTLTKSNFDDVIKQNQFVLVEFYAPWCGHCKKLAPLYETAAKNLKDEGFVLAKVDATVETELGTEYGIRGYPTLKLFKKGKFFTDFNGERTAGGIATWLKKMTGPASTVLATKEEYDAFLGKSSLTHVVAFIPEEDAEKYMGGVEGTEFSEITFGHVTDKDLIASLNQKPNTIVVFEKGNVIATFSETLTEESVRNFVLKSGYPRLEKLNFTAEFVMRINKKELPLVIVARDEKKSKKTLDEQYELAKKLSESKLDATFVEFNTKDNPTLAKQWGASGDVFPTVILLRFINGAPKLTAFNEEKELTAESALAWLEDCVAGKECEGNLLSQPIPEKNDAPVKDVVGKTFKSIVYDETKDVVVEFYSPTCGFCKKIVEPYNEFAKSYEGDNGVLITKIDATANSYPDTFAVNGYPTIYLFKANDKKNPVQFEKTERTAEKFREFVEEHRTTKSGQKDEL